MGSRYIRICSKVINEIKGIISENRIHQISIENIPLNKREIHIGEIVGDISFKTE